MKHRVICLAVLMPALGWLSAHVHAGETAEEIDFAQDIRPILSGRCFACHGPDEESRKADLRLDDRRAAIKAHDSTAALVPGDAEASELLRRVTASDPEMRMPPTDAGPPLSDREIELLKGWINAGAKYEAHWSFEAVERPTLPEVENEAWCRNEIDYFVLAKLEKAGLSPAAEADRYRLIRRLSLDLTGLPPTPEEVDEFVLDHRADAYERLVERLLASPRYGEHWARKWLDLARYADSQGYAQDEPRVIWRYRDWLIEALNRDLPYDQFTIEQLAGDMLPEPTKEQLLATAFHRNTMTNTEGGTDDEEFRFAAVVDRVNTTMQVWMGLTAGCAQCHSHKYDPITQDEYYGLFAIFNQSADSDKPDNRPTISAPTGGQAERLAKLEAQLREFALEGAPPAPGMVEIHQRYEKLKKSRDQLAKSIPQIPVMRELPEDKQRTTHLHIRGAFNDKGDVVEPGVPEAFAWEGVAPRDRLQLARWLVDPRNVLTTRVAVNRQWEQLFGQGILVTSEDFGTQGALPSHPQLLDWLAHEFIERGWSMKEVCRLIVTSAAYRQSSVVTPVKLAADPNNRLVSRGARFRLSAEQVRDQALAVSGLLSDKMYGPSVKPPKPKSGLQAAFGASLDWDPSEGEDRYRRGLYTFWRRTDPYPSMMALDATGRNVCTIRRVRTNTPVGAFVTLNDPVFFEAAQALARLVFSQQPQATNAEIGTAMFRCVLARHPNSQEVEHLVALVQELEPHYNDLPADAEKLVGQSADKELAPGRLAAWTVVANVLLNLDEAMTRN